MKGLEAIKRGGGGGLPCGGGEWGGAARRAQQSPLGSEYSVLRALPELCPSSARAPARLHFYEGFGKFSACGDFRKKFPKTSITDKKAFEFCARGLSNICILEHL